jgi:DNA-binding MarR family transcriptional regulator
MPQPTKRQTSGLAAEIGKRHPFASVEQEAMLNVLRTAATLSEPMNRLLKRHDMSMAKFNILRILSGEGAPTPCSVIKERMISSVPDVSRIIDRMEAKGLVERIRSTQDRRVVEVQISGSGQRLLTKLNPLVMQEHKSLLSSIPNSDLATLNRILVAVRASIASPTG